MFVEFFTFYQVNYWILYGIGVGSNIKEYGNYQNHHGLVGYSPKIEGLELKNCSPKNSERLARTRKQTKPGKIGLKTELVIRLTSLSSRIEPC